MPLFIEFIVEDSLSKTLKKLKTTITNYLFGVYGGERIFNFKIVGNSLVIEAVNEYQRFATLSIEKLIPEANHYMGAWKVLKSIDDLTAVDTAENVEEDMYFVGKEGFGTYDYILHNLRLPTSARTGFMAINEEENPHRGATYTQYTIHYCVDRGTLGTNAVGDQVTSTTTHVLYVNDAISGVMPDGEVDGEDKGFSKVSFNDAIQEIGTIEDVPAEP